MPFQIVKDNLLNLRCDAIIVPTDTRLSGVVGVDALIRRFAGEDFAQACRDAAPLDYGEAAPLPSPKLRCRSVIFTAAPWWSGQAEELAQLRGCYRNSLLTASGQGFDRIALPLIGCGTRGFPEELVMETALAEIGGFLAGHPDMEITLVVFDRRMYRPNPTLLADLDVFIRAARPEAQLFAEGDMLQNASTGAFPAIGAADIAREKRRYAVSAPSAPRRPSESDLHEAAPAAATSAPPFPRFEPERGAVLDESFSRMVLRKIDERGFRKDSDCYSRANIDKRLFSKIRCDAGYHPKKTTAVALAVALELSPEETEELLMKAGYRLSRSILFDVIVEYCIAHRMYNIHEINALLFEYDQPLLGC